MKLIESYSLNTALKISEPHLELNYYPIPYQRYITIHNSSGMDSKNYDYWQEVVDCIAPKLDEMNYGIVQIGGKDDTPIKGAFFLGGKTNISQTGYILKNSFLHLSNDSFSAHVAAHFETLLVALYGPTTVANHSPYFGKPDKMRLLESGRSGNDPSYSPQEFLKTVNEIKVEKIVEAIESLTQWGLSKTKTVYMGDNFKLNIIEIVPDFKLDPSRYNKDVVINARMDYHFDEQNLAHLLSHYKVHVITDKIIDKKLLTFYKTQVKMLTLEVNVDNANEELQTYLQEIKKNGINFQLVTEESDENKLRDIRFALFEYNVQQELLPSKEDIKADFSRKAKYKTGKLIMSRNKVYMSKAAWSKDKSVDIESVNEQEIIYSDEFWKELKYLYIYEDAS